MTTLDFIYVALFAVVWPLFDYCVLWPAFLRRSQADAARARKWIWAVTLAEEWALVAAGIVLWVSNERDWTSLGLVLPKGWRLWGSVGLALLLVVFHARTAARVARSSRAQASVRKQIGALAAMLPHTWPELGWFVGVSLTAGFCEEFLFRGYFIRSFEPWLGWWGAAGLSVPFFAVAHAYQGLNGAIRSGIIGAVLTLVVAIFDSLWPAIALHAVVDIGSGTIVWLAVRGMFVEGDGSEGGGSKATDP
jgi:membrane protease YdiL (CAAX protease family)